MQKFIARSGIASRRAAEELIQQGRVMVNGHVVRELGVKADPRHDRIVVDGHPLKLPTGPPTVVLLHKPTGVVTTKQDPEGRTTITHLLPDKYKHLHPIGRLDYDTSGVLLLTDDGSLTQLLTHPSHRVEKVYWARVPGTVTVATIKRLETGLYLEEGKTAPCKARVRAQTARNALVQITLVEGRNRQVRRMLEEVGHPVRALRRVRFAGFDLEGLPSGAHRLLLPGEVHALRKSAEAKTPGPSKTQSSRTKQARTRPSAAKPSVPKPPMERPPIAKMSESRPSSTKSLPARSSKPKISTPQRPAGRHSSGQHPVARRIEQQWGEKTRRRPN